MEKWFKDYGFDRELVLEACSRTINAIHTPSFQYADSILTDWKKAGVKTLADVKGMDARRAERAQNGAVKRLQSYGNGAAAQNNRKTSQNQFHNFKQRDTDYDALMLQNVKEWMDSPELIRRQDIMALSNSQYDAIMREYGKQQMENQHSQEARKKEIYQKVPAVKELEAEIAERSVACARKLLEGNQEAIYELREKLADLKEQKALLIKAAGYSG